MLLRDKNLPRDFPKNRVPITGPRWVSQLLNILWRRVTRIVAPKLPTLPVMYSAKQEEVPDN